MTTITFSLDSHPLVTSLGEISWLKELRATEPAEPITVIEGTQPGQLATRAALVGELDDYCIYFLTSRARVKLVPMSIDGHQPFLINKCDANGTISCQMLLETDVPKNTDPARATATLTVSPELEKLVQDIAGTKSKVRGVCLPEQAGFANALQFDFDQSEGIVGSIAMYITPTLTRFITIDSKEEAEDFFPAAMYEIHYIGQTKTTVEGRLNAHEKIRMLADSLFRQHLDREPVVFSYTYSCDVQLDPELQLDLLEAALISHFKPTLNIDKKSFPEGDSPTEKGLRNQLRIHTPCTHVKVSPFDHLFGTLPSPFCLAHGIGFTYAAEGKVRSTSYQDIVIEFQTSME